MQVHGSTPGDSQRVEDVAIIDTGLARNPQPGMSQKGGKRQLAERQETGGEEAFPRDAGSPDSDLSGTRNIGTRLTA
jgi:hypothetical protein